MRPGAEPSASLNVNHPQYLSTLVTLIQWKAWVLSSSNQIWVSRKFVLVDPLDFGILVDDVEHFSGRCYHIIFLLVVFPLFCFLEILLAPGLASIFRGNLPRLQMKWNSYQEQFPQSPAKEESRKMILFCQGKAMERRQRQIKYIQELSSLPVFSYRDKTIDEHQTYDIGIHSNCWSMKCKMFLLSLSGNCYGTFILNIGDFISLRDLALQTVKWNDNKRRRLAPSLSLQNDVNINKPCMLITCRNGKDEVSSIYNIFLVIQILLSAAICLWTLAKSPWPGCGAGDCCRAGLRLLRPILWQ